jgi:hypothetical protein
MVVAPPQGEVNETYFYESLSPYGTWIAVDGAWVWRPAVVMENPDWRPYCHDGHWVYTDWGWTWYSDYSWGWAPFHYGRWHHHPHHGWVWYPGTTWGPAWVSWRMGDSHCGWAPLPPTARYVAGSGFFYNGRVVAASFGFGLGAADYVFVSSGHFCEPSLHRRLLPPAQVAVVYERTVVLNNYTSRDHRIFNGGPEIRHIEAAGGGRPIPQRRLVDENRLPSQRGHGEDARQNTFSVYRPNFRPAANTSAATLTPAPAPAPVRPAASPKLFAPDSSAGSLKPAAVTQPVLRPGIVPAPAPLAPAPAGLAPASPSPTLRPGGTTLAPAAVPVPVIPSGTGRTDAGRPAAVDPAHGSVHGPREQDRRETDAQRAAELKRQQDEAAKRQQQEAIAKRQQQLDDLQKQREDAAKRAAELKRQQDEAVKQQQAAAAAALRQQQEEAARRQQEAIAKRQQQLEAARQQQAAAAEAVRQQQAEARAAAEARAREAVIQRQPIQPPQPVAPIQPRTVTPAPVAPSPSPAPDASPSVRDPNSKPQRH